MTINQTSTSLRIHGKSASPGRVIGRVLTYSNEPVPVSSHRVENSDQEIARFLLAIELSKAEIQKIHRDAIVLLGEEEATVFEAHLLFLEDPELVESTTDLIKNEHRNAEAALAQISENLVRTFLSMESEYMRERSSDVRDVCNRVLRNLSGKKNQTLSDLADEVILVTRDLTPSDTSSMRKDKVLGILTDIGGKTSHTAIMARTLEIPAVLGLQNVTSLVQDGDLIAFDGETGEVILRPTEAELSQFRKLQEQDRLKKNQLEIQRGLDSETNDGRRVHLVANIGTPKDLELVKKNDAEGVGLYRTEFLFMDRTQMPSEEEQTEAYKVVLLAMNHKLCVIRTLDVGGDKHVPYLNIGKEENPFLGFRALRYCLSDLDVFKTQMRALLRASPAGRLAVMFPMVTTLEELLQTREIWESTKLELKAEGIPFSRDIQIGIMIETPAAVWAAESLAKHCDFLSIGTNDLIQYTTASDRMNERVSYLYDYHNPSVLRSIDHVIRAGNAQGAWVGMCGEMAGTPEWIPLLLGMGLKEFSMSPTSILRARSIIRNVGYAKCVALRDAVIKLDRIAEIKKALEDFNSGVR